MTEEGIKITFIVFALMGALAIYLTFRLARYLDKKDDEYLKRQQ